MRKIITLLLVIMASLVLLQPTIVNTEATENVYTVTNFNELSSALANTNNAEFTKIIVDGQINIEQNLTIKGKVLFVGTGSSKLIFEHDNKKRSIYNTVNSDIRFEDIIISRTVTNAAADFMFQLNNKGSIWFTDTRFEIAIAEEGPNTDIDRITYCPTGVDVTLYFNNCTYDTEAYFYRGTMVFFNSDLMPSTAGSPTIKNFNDFKIDYHNKVFTFPSNIKVSEYEDFERNMKSGKQFKSFTTYYLMKDNYTFSFTTKDLKHKTPTLTSVDFDFENEVVNFSDDFLVSSNSDFTKLLTSGDKIAPGMKLYIKQLASGVYFDSEVFEVTLPQRPKAIQLECDYVCSFGFVMKYYDNVEFSIGAEYQLSPVFVGLSSNTKYTIKMRVKATDTNFASETCEITVTTTK